MNPLQALAEHGQSIWFDYIRRGTTRSGELRRLVEEDGVRGVTSNPAIFEKAIGGSDDYAEILETLAPDESLDAKGLYEAIAVGDIREACDVLRTVYDASAGADGFVSLEVSPGLARDTEGTVEEARRLWAAVDRPNLMIKVPGTAEGIAAVERLIAEGINVNVTLIFACDAYEAIAHAYLRGLEARLEAGGDLRTVASVASFFVSRIDTEVDAMLERRLEKTEDPARRAELKALMGKIAIANAKMAYRIYQRILESPRWKALADRGARPQRLLWASTGTKNPAYSDVLYVEELIGPQTVNTVPPQTLEAFRDHGRPRPSLLENVDEAQRQMEALERAGISMQAVTDALLERGLVSFAESMDALLATVARVQRKARGGRLDGFGRRLPAELAAKVDARLRAWDEARGTERLWKRDEHLWTGSGEDRWLGWLDAVAREKKEIAGLKAFAEAVEGRFRHVVLMGMGGSSLCPDVLARTYGPRLRKAGWPELVVLDSTVPAQVARVEASIDPERTLFVVASKSGMTLEPNAFMHFFLDRARTKLGKAASQQFVAITDPGSKLETFARAEKFGWVFYGVPEIGGRFSALSQFGMVPAAAMGLDVAAFLAEAERMVEACKPGRSAADHPGVSLGITMGVAAREGRDKLTIVASPAIAGMGAWLEQLVAESTGKSGRAIIPVDGEPPGDPHRYADDRLFVYLRLRSTPDAGQDRAIAALESMGQAVVRIDLDDIDALPQELYRWEIATAVAGAVMELNPFDQPDVEASKVATRAMTSAFERTGKLPAEEPVLRDGVLSVYTDRANAEALGEHGDVVGLLRAHLGRLGAGDYFALLAYIDMTEAHERALQRMRVRVRDARSVATCVGFGPRFLHSTGQAYKGGPNTGVFLQITGDDPCDLAIPGFGYTFAVVRDAQARGDFAVLTERRRRALRVHVHGDPTEGLEALDRALATALGDAP